MRTSQRHRNHPQNPQLEYNARILAVIVYTQPAPPSVTRISWHLNGCRIEKVSESQTGSPLMVEDFDLVLTKVKMRLLLNSKVYLYSLWDDLMSLTAVNWEQRTPRLHPECHPGLPDGRSQAHRGSCTDTTSHQHATAGGNFHPDCAYSAANRTRANPHSCRYHSSQFIVRPGRSRQPDRCHDPRQYQASVE
jgi:hypothetical protein